MRCASIEWVLELQEYEFDFQVDHTKKAQLLADVLVNKEVDIPSYPRVAKAKYDEEPDIGDAFTLWFDGAYIAWFFNEQAVELSYRTLKAKSFLRKHMILMMFIPTMRQSIWLYTWVSNNVKSLGFLG